MRTPRNRVRISRACYEISQYPQREKASDYRCPTDRYMSGQLNPSDIQRKCPGEPVEDVPWHTKYRVHGHGVDMSLMTDCLVPEKVCHAWNDEHPGSHTTPRRISTTRLQAITIGIAVGPHASPTKTRIRAAPLRTPG